MKKIMTLTFLAVVLLTGAAIAQVTAPVMITDPNWNDAISLLMSGIQGKAYLTIAFALIQITVLILKATGVHKKIPGDFGQKYGALIINSVLSAAMSIVGLIAGGMNWTAAIVLFLGGPAFGKIVNDVEKKTSDREE